MKGIGDLLNYTNNYDPKRETSLTLETSAETRQSNVKYYLKQLSRLNSTVFDFINLEKINFSKKITESFIVIKEIRQHKLLRQ